METLLDVLQKKRGTYDAVALATRITPHIDTVELHRAYFGKGGPNPWGGVEAVLTHTTSTVLNAPTAHAPTMSSEAIRTERWGVVEPRKAAEVITSTYLFCVLKGLNRAPQVVTKVERRLRPVDGPGRGHLGPGHPRRLRGPADAGGGRARHPRHRGSQQHEPDAERPAAICRSATAS